MANKVKVVNRLPKVLSAIDRQAASAVTAAVIRGGSELTDLVPVDTSNLLNSQFRAVEKRGSRIVGTIGFTANYAKFVHEASGKLKGLKRPPRDGKDRGQYWGPHDGQPHFLAVAFKRAKPSIDAIVKRTLKLK